MDYFQLLKHISDTGIETSPRGIKTKEVLNAHLTIDNYNFFAVPPDRPLEKVSRYLYGELAWYFSGSCFVADIAPYSKFWEKIANDKGIVNSNYGYLVFYKVTKNGYTPYSWAKEQLLRDPNSRQAIILYNDKDGYYSGNKDFICTQLQHFFIRDNKLHSFIYLRSSDAILGLTYDIPWWSVVQQNLAHELNVEVGKLEVTIGSAHFYENKYELVKTIIESENKEKYFVKLLQPIKLDLVMRGYENLMDKFIDVRRV